jgi:transposase
MARVEVITGSERRRRWSAEQKRAIVAESLAAGAVVAEIARRADICRGQICRRRREIRVGNGFAQVLIAPVGDGAGCPAAPAIEFARFALSLRFVAPAAEKFLEIVAQTADGFGIIGRQAVGKARAAACARGLALMMACKPFNRWVGRRLTAVDPRYGTTGPEECAFQMV